MAIVGIGTDVIEIERVAKASVKESFITKYFTGKEKELFMSRRNNAEVIAGNMAAKECFVKVLGSGFRGVSPKEIEVLRNENGKPYINLSGNARQYAELLKIGSVHVSISHNRTTCFAVVIAEDGIVAAE